MGTEEGTPVQQPRPLSRSFKGEQEEDEQEDMTQATITMITTTQTTMTVMMTTTMMTIMILEERTGVETPKQSTEDETLEERTEEGTPVQQPRPLSRSFKGEQEEDEQEE